MLRAKMAQTTHLSADRLVVTDGRRQYRVHRPWARLRNGREFGRISQVAVARDGRVVVVQRDAPAVLLFAPDGELDNTWHHRKLDSVHGVAAAPDGSLLITSFDLHQVLRNARMRFAARLPFTVLNYIHALTKAFERE
jgi:glucose/arabinose dehydrogenase